ncbi:glycosyltransferase family 4 protein [Streptomyces sp. NPDC047737]|uniref:glycosyltransferase family 4 protein n=1 Tax=unclassified Streptomyces TaxID=2593676 RepID=UPI0033F0ED1F
MSQLRTVQVLGGGAGSSAHVSSLAAGLIARGVQVTVCAPAGTGRAHGLPATGALFVAVPRRSDPAALAALRTACTGADIVHAHGLHAALRAGLALSGRGTPLVVTWHTSADVEGARARLQRMLERRAARAAAVVLGTSWDLVDRARRRGARDARLAPAPVPAGRLPGAADDGKLRAELGAVGRPLLVSVAQPDHGVLLDAAREWQALDPAPLLVVAGEGPEAGALRSRAVEEGLPVAFTDARDGFAELLSTADLALVAGRGAAGPSLAQEALRLGVPVVATRSDGLPELVGDAADLVAYGDAPALSGAVAQLLADPGRRARLADAGRAQAAGWPTEEDTIAHVLSVYDELAQPLTVDRA